MDLSAPVMFPPLLARKPMLRWLASIICRLWLRVLNQPIVQLKELFNQEADGRIDAFDIGVLSPADIEAAIPPQSWAFPIPTLLSLENTHNAAGGTCITPEKMAEYVKNVYQF